VLSLVNPPERQALKYVGKPSGEYGLVCVIDTDGVIISSWVSVRVENIGYKPIKDTSISLTPGCPEVSLQVGEIRVVPPYSLEIEWTGETIRAKTDAVLAPGDSMKFSVPVSLTLLVDEKRLEQCLDVFVFSDVGFVEPLVVSTQVKVMPPITYYVPTTVHLEE
jgi:hypothetical protein